MTTDPDQIRAEINALLAQLPDPADITDDPRTGRRSPTWKRWHAVFPRRTTCCYGPWNRRRRAECAHASACPHRRRAGAARPGPIPSAGRGVDRRRQGAHRRPAGRQTGHRRRRHRGADRGRRRRTHLGVARRAQTHRCAGRLRDLRRGPPLPGRRRVDGWVHRSAAGSRGGRGGCRRRGVRPAGLVAALRSAGGRRRANQRSRPVARGDRRAGRPGGG